MFCSSQFLQPSNQSSTLDYQVCHQNRFENVFIYYVDGLPHYHAKILPELYSSENSKTYKFVIDDSSFSKNQKNGTTEKSSDTKKEPKEESMKYYFSLHQQKTDSLQFKKRNYKTLLTGNKDLAYKDVE